MLDLKLFKKISKYYLAFLLLIFPYVFTREKTIAQVIDDGTLGTKVNLIDGQNIITGGQEAGTNLFHSFKEFSPTPDAVTYFNNSSNIENIFSRVTGGIPSFIDGAIKTNDASLFLINPSGIIFGSNVSLNINGSFLATTAESVIFADGTSFDTNVNNSQPLLTISMPIGLQYGTNPGSIDISFGGIDNPLALEKIKTIALLGGEVSLQNTKITAVEESELAKIEVAGIGNNEVIGLENNNGSWNFDYTNVTNFENVYLGARLVFDSGGIPVSINLRGDNIILNDSLILNSNNTNLEGGNISLKASNSIELNKSFLLTQVTITRDDDEIPTTSGGDILIKAKSLILTQGSIILTETLNQGTGGNIQIQTEKYVDISGFGEDSEIFLPSSIAVTVAEKASGSGGNIEIKTGELRISDGGRIDSSTKGIGDAGTISITAKDSIILSGKNGNFNSGLYASSGAGEVKSNNITGRGGDLNIYTPQLLLQEGGRISVEAQKNANAGEIFIDTTNIVLFEDSEIVARAEAGKGGNIRIQTQGLFPNDAIEKNQIDASSDLGIDGEIKIISPDIDTKISSELKERSPIATENLIHTSCGLNSDFSANKFRYIGRGGIFPSPLNVIAEDIVGELGAVDYVQETTIIEPKNNVTLPPVPEITKDLASQATPDNIDSNHIQEATTWKINDRGNVELVAESSKVTRVDSECPMSK